MPTLFHRLLGVAWGLDTVGLCPGELLRVAETTAVLPTLFRTSAAAGVVLTGKRGAPILAGWSGDRKADGRHQVSRQGQAGGDPAGPSSPVVSSPGAEHRRQVVSIKVVRLTTIV